MPPLRYLPYHLQCHPNLGPNQTPQTLGYLCLARKSAPGPDSPMSESCRIFGRKVSGKDIRRRFSEWFACHDLNRLWSRISHLTNQKAEKKETSWKWKGSTRKSKSFEKSSDMRGRVPYSVVFLLLFVTIFGSICYATLFHIFFCNKILDENSVPTPKIASSKTQFSSIQKLFAACLLSIFSQLFFFFFISPLYFQIYSKVSKIWIIERPKRSAPRTKIGFDIWSIIDEEDHEYCKFVHWVIFGYI